MTPKPSRSLVIFSLLLALVLTLIPAPARAQGEPSLPSLDAFINVVRNGDASVLRGLYIPGVLAGVVIQQPDDDPAYVSSVENTLTQFGLASGFGAIGLLAHNHLAGKSFSGLADGQVFYLIHGDGTVATFIITHRLRYRALQPNSLTSNFVSLDDGSFLTSSELLTKAYDRPRDVILQTCITANGIDSWGRLFLIAEPYNGSNLNSASGRKQ